MMFADSRLEAMGATYPSWSGVIRAKCDSASFAEFKWLSAVEYPPTSLMILFARDLAIPGQSLPVPQLTSMSTVGVGSLRREANCNTFNEIVSTTPLDRLIGRLRGYKLLGPNWNGYGGQPPSSSAVEDCINFLRGLDSSRLLPKPMVGGDGEVGVFWETDAIYIEVGFRGDERLEYLVSIDGKDLEGTCLLGETVVDLTKGLALIPCS